MPYVGKSSSTGQYTRAEAIRSLEQVATAYGIKIKENKPSLFKRTMDLLSRPLYASAGASEAIIKNLDADTTNNQNVLQEAWNGFTGKDKTTYSDVLKQVGIENKYARGIAGFALDVALDPSTYFGGTLIKGAGKAIGATAKGAGKVATAAGLGREVKVLAATGKTIKDAFGELFVPFYGSTKGLDNKVIETLNKFGLAKEDTLKTFQNTFGKTFSKYSKEDVMSAGKLLEKNRQIEYQITRQGKKLDYIDIPDNLKDLYSDLQKHGNEIAKISGLPEEVWYKNYFPLIFKDKNIAAKSIKVGTEDYKKVFKNIANTEMDNVVKSPIEALSRRHYEVIRDNIARESLDDMVKAFGKSTEEFNKLSAAEKLLYSEIKEKAGGKQVGYLLKKDAEAVSNFLYPEMKAVDLLARASGYDAFTNFFKGAVTSLFPAFHVRNMLSGHVQNYSVLGASAFDPRNISTGLAVSSNKINKLLNFAEFKGTTQELRDALIKRFRGSTRYIADLGDAIEESANGVLKFKSNFNPMKYGKEVGGWIEFNQKANATVSALRQGKTLEEAMNLAEKAGFNYAKITPFESKIMRRLIPFYTFARKNAELQLSTLAKNPERILNQIKFTNSLSNIFGGDKPTEDELAGLPPWALDGLGFKLQDGKYVSKFGFPIEDFINRINDPIKSSLTSLNPIIKYPVEFQTGYDLFREKQIKDLNSSDKMVYDLVSNKKTPQFIKDIFSVTTYKDKSGKDRYTADSTALHLLRNLPTSRLQSTLSKIYDGNMDTVNKYLSLFSGLRIEDIDQELQANFREKDLMQAYQDELKRRGLGFDWNMFLLNNEKIGSELQGEVKAIEKESKLTE